LSYHSLNDHFDSKIVEPNTTKKIDHP